MKKPVTCLFAGVMLLLSLSAASAQTASDFNVNDCSGKSHHLFSELDAGKIVVICFVMPCGTCIGPAQAAYTTVQEYETSHPGKVLFYLADDFANNTCGTLTAWANNNGMSGVTAFAHKDVTEVPYGSGGMPKTVVLGGWDHKVHFVQNSSLNVSNLKNAINSALSLSSVTKSGTSAGFQLNVYPNPAINNLSVTYDLAHSTDIGLAIYSMTGVLVKRIEPVMQEPGEQSVSIDLTALSEGIYILKMDGDDFFSSIKFVVQR